MFPIMNAHYTGRECAPPPARGNAYEWGKGEAGRAGERREGKRNEGGKEGGGEDRVREALTNSPKTKSMVDNVKYWFEIGQAALKKAFIIVSLCRLGE